MNGKFFSGSEKILALIRGVTSVSERLISPAL
jgi:hypothetical protein